MALPALLSGKRIAVLGSASALGLALAQAAEAAGAEVHGIDHSRSFQGLTAFYLSTLDNPDALQATAHALPDGLDGIALLPDLRFSNPRDVLVHGLLAPRILVQELAPRLARGASIVLRGAPISHHWKSSLPEIRAAMTLRHDAVDSFIKRWGLDLDHARAGRTVGWALSAWAMAQSWTWTAQAVRINTLTPVSTDGHLPAQVTAAIGQAAVRGTETAAQAALFLLSDLSQGMAGTNLVVDGGLTAQNLCRHNGL